MTASVREDEASNMASAAVVIFNLIILNTWKVLVDSPSVLKIYWYDEYQTSMSVLETIASKASLTFAPGLLEVLSCLTPPTIDFIKTLPSPSRSELTRTWIVYAILLEKPNCRPKLYIGSATSSRDGASARWGQYETQTYLSSNIFDALKDGFSITHKGVLCEAPKPHVSFMPIRCLLFLVLEKYFCLSVLGFEVYEERLLRYEPYLSMAPGASGVGWTMLAS